MSFRFGLDSSSAEGQTEAIRLQKELRGREQLKLYKKQRRAEEFLCDRYANAADWADPDPDHLVPEDFVCPISHRLMKEPVIHVDGMLYEHDVIRMELRRGNPEMPVHLRPHDTLRAAIDA